MDYIEELEKIIRNKELSNEQWKELVCDLIQIIPENKYTRVNYLINKDELKENLTYEEIENILETIIIDAEDGKYCDDSYFDYGLDEEIVIGDESWIDEIDRAFIGIKGLFNQKKYEQVILLYEKIFEITERNYEELHSLLPKYYDIEEILESKVEEHYYNYLEAIFYSKDINTMEKLATAFKEHNYNYEKGNIIHEFCKNHENFTKEMIKPIINMLLQERRFYIEKIIFKLLIEKNGTEEVLEFLKENINKNIWVFNELCNYMEKKGEYKKLLEYLYILENTTINQHHKELIYEKIIDIGNILEDNKLQKTYLYKINELHPTLKYTLEICKNLSSEKKIEQMKKLEEKVINNKDEEEEKILVELALGNIDKTYIIYEKIEKYQKKNIEEIITYYLLRYSGKATEKRILEEELKTKIKQMNLSIDIKELFNIMELTKKEVAQEFILKIEKEFKNKIARKTRDYLSRQERGMYIVVATYLVILVEHLYQEGRKEETLILLQTYRENYKQYSAYKKCLNEALNKSSISSKEV